MVMNNTIDEKITKIHRHLGEFSVVNYASYGADKLPDGELELHFDKCDKKVFVYKNDIVYGSLKLNEMEQKYIFAILSSGMNLLECSRIPSDEKTPLEQKFKVSLWMRCSPFVGVDFEKGITVSATKEGSESAVNITIYKDRAEDAGSAIKAEDVNKYKLVSINCSMSSAQEVEVGPKIGSTCCSIQKIQELLRLFKCR